MTKTTTSPSDNAAADALDAAMQMVNGVDGQGTTQAGATTYNPKKSKTVEIEHLDFKYVAKCKDGKEVERILKALRSGKEGRYFELEAATERRLKELYPESQLLKKMEPTINLRAMPRSQREDLLGSLDSWSADMEAANSDATAAAAAATRAAEPTRATRLPPVRGQAAMTTSAGAPEPAKKAKKAKKAKAKQAIPGGDFAAWDKYDVDGALEEVDAEHDAEAAKSEDDDASATGGSDRTVVNTGKLPKAKLSKKPASEVECQRLATREKEKGNECFRAGDYDEAIVYYSRSLDAWSTPAVHNNRALANLKLKRYLKTIADCDQVLKSEPGNFKAMVRKANALKGGSRVDEALAVISVALELKPTSKEALGIKTELLKAQGGSGKTAAPKRRMVIEEMDSDEEDEEEDEDVEEISTVDPKIFQKAKKFNGSRSGFVFQMGVHGVGYYKDPMAAAHAKDPEPDTEPEPEPEPAKVATPRRIAIVEDDSDDSDDDDAAVASNGKPAAASAAADRAEQKSPVRRVVVVEDDSDDDSDSSAGAEEETAATTSSEPTSSEPASESTSGSASKEPPSRVEVIDEPETPLPPVPQSVTAAKDEGKKFFVAGDYGQAAEHYSRALDLLTAAAQGSTPMAATLLSNRAACNLKTGQCRASVEDCNAALAITGTDAKLLLRRAAANEQRERYKDAFIDYKDVLAMYPGHKVASEGFARAKKAVEFTSDFKWLREQQGKPANVKGSPRSTRREQPLSQRTTASSTSSTGTSKFGPSYDELKGQGNKHVKEKRFVDAIACYTKCIAVDPSQGAAFNNRALCHLKLKQFAKAAADAKAVLALEPKNAKAMFRRAQGLVGMGSLDDAKAAFGVLLKADPKHKTGKAELVALEGAILQKQLDELSTKRDQIEVERKQAQSNVTAVKTQTAKVSKVVEAKKTELESHEAKLKEAESEFDAGLANMKDILKNEIEIIDESETAAAAAAAAATTATTATPEPRGNASGGTAATASPAKANTAPSPQKAMPRTPKQTKAKAKAKTKTPLSKRSSPSKRGTPSKSAPLEFMRKMMAFKGDAQKLATYLETVQPSSLPRLFSNRLEADHMVVIANAAALMPGDGGFQMLQSLTTVDRFDIASMLLSDEDRAAIGKTFAAVAESGAVEKSVVSSVASKFD